MAETRETVSSVDVLPTRFGQIENSHNSRCGLMLCEIGRDSIRANILENDERKTHSSLTPNK